MRYELTSTGLPLAPLRLVEHRDGVEIDHGTGRAELQHPMHGPVNENCRLIFTPTDPAAKPITIEDANVTWDDHCE